MKQLNAYRSRYGLLAALIFAALPQVARADDAEIKAVIDGYHAAIATANMTQLAALWLQAPDVALVNPRDTSIAVGWTAVSGRWQRLFAGEATFEIAQREGPHITVAGDAAWSVGTAHVITHLKTKETIQVDLVETDVFVKRDGHWLIAAHTALPM